MKRLTTLLALCATTAGNAFGANPGLEWTYQNALVNSERGTELQYVFVDIEADATLRTQPMLDLLMEVTLFNVTNLPYSQVDLMRMTRIVYRSEDPRYVTAMAQLARASADTGPYITDQAKRREDVNELASRFVKRFAKNSVPQYPVGSISIEGMRAHYVEAALKAKHPAEQARKLLALPTGIDGATLDEVFAATGAPEVVDIGTERSTYRGQRTGKENQMQFLYRGLGRATFYYKRDLGWRLAAVLVDPLRFEREMPYWKYPASVGRPDENTLLLQALLSERFDYLRMAMESVAAADLPLEVTDTAAEVLWQEFKEQPSVAAGSAYLAICHALLGRDGARYARVLERVTAESTDVRIQGLASSVAELAAAEPASSYLPGSVSLAAQRRKYPPLYPDSMHSVQEQSP